MNILSITVIALLCIVLFWQMKPAPRGELFDNSFSLPVSKGLQGFLALQIFVHHVYVFLNIRNVDAGRLRIFSTIGVWLIGFFFFCSGYGLITSLRTKQDYLKGFLVKRVLIVLVPFFLCNYAYMSVELLRGMQFSTPELIALFFGVLLMNSQMWFAVEIMLLYIVFFLLFTYVKKEKVCIMTIVALTAMITLIGMLNTRPFCLSNWFWGEWWYNTTPLFAVGMLASMTKDRLNELAKKHYRVMLPGSLAGLVIFKVISDRMLQTHGYWTPRIGDKVITYLFQMPSVIFFVAFVVLLLKKVRFKNPLLDFFGKFSLEIILVSGVFLNLFYEAAISYGLVCYMCLSFVGTILTAVILYKLKRFILEIR